MRPYLSLKRLRLAAIGVLTVCLRLAQLHSDARDIEQVAVIRGSAAV